MKVEGREVDIVGSVERVLGIKNPPVEEDPIKQRAIQIVVGSGVDSYMFMYGTLCKLYKYNKFEYFKELEKIREERIMEDLFENILKDNRFGTHACLNEIEEEFREFYIDKRGTLQYSKTSLMASRPMKLFEDLYKLCASIDEPGSRYLIKYKVMNWKRHNSLDFFYRRKHKEGLKYMKERRNKREWQRKANIIAKAFMPNIRSSLLLVIISFVVPLVIFICVVCFKF